jgi:hypothetical protein
MIPYGYVKRGSGNIHPHNECGICGKARFSAKKVRQKSRQEIMRELSHDMTEAEWDKLAEMFEVQGYDTAEDKRRDTKSDLYDSGDKDGQSK